MFLHALTSDQQRLFCALARHLILVDDVLHDHEAEIERVVLRELDLSEFPHDVRPLPEVFAEVRRIDSEAQRNAVYVELVGIALVDQEMHPAEAELLDSLRQELSISDDTARALTDFAERFHLLAAEGRLLVFETAALNGVEGAA